MTDNLFLDIETIPAQRPDILAEIIQDTEAERDAAMEAVRPPSNYKDAEKISEWWQTVGNSRKNTIVAEFDAKVDECYRKTALDGSFGQVCAIGFAFNDDEPAVLSGMDESALLTNFTQSLKARAPNIFDATVIGHNVAGFDLRFITQRSIVRGVRPHPLITRAAAAKPWEQDKVFDTMVQWAGIGGRVSLVKLCKALDIKSSKGDLDGSKVWDYVKAGRLDEVAEYCAGDVRDVRAVFWRMTFAPLHVLQAA